MLLKLITSKDPADQRRLRELWSEWRELAESKSVGNLQPIAQPLPLVHYYEQYIRPTETTTEQVSDQMLCLYVSLVSKESDRCFGLNDYKLYYYFGKFEEKEYFQRERAAHLVLASANCPHIIKLHRAIETNEIGEGIIITPRYNPYSTELLPHVKEVMRQLLKAIVCCHEHDIIHRDIKPQNIVWGWKQDNTPHIFLTDFGVACKPDYYKDTSCDCVDYTAIYCAPERMRWEVTDQPKKMDLWSAGVMFAEMLLGYDSDNKTLFKWGDVEELSEFESKRHKLFMNIDPVARDLVDKLLAVDVKDRLSAAEALQHPYFTTQTTDHQEETSQQPSNVSPRKRKRANNKGSKGNKKRRHS